MPNDPELLAGKCFIGIGSYQPDMREFPSAIWDVCDEVYADLKYAIEESGDLSQPLEEGFITRERIKLISDIIDKEPIMPSRGKSTFFKSVGFGLVDIVSADAIYRRAVERNIGLEYDF